MLNLLKRIHFDSAVIFVILQRGWSSLAGLLTLFLLINYLTEIELGYYYTFASLIGLQMIFELGLTTVIRQFVSHEMAELRVKNGFLTGSPIQRKRLLNLIVKSIKIYALICGIIILIITPCGLLFFSTSTSSLDVSWQAPWLILVLFSSLNCFISVVTAILEGMGFINRVKKVLFLSAVISSCSVWFVLLNGYGLYAPALVNLIGFLCVSSWVWYSFKKLFIQAFKANNNDSKVTWSRDIWPVQWRVAVSWIGGYFIFYIINPIAFKFYGAEFSGKLGITFQIVNLLLSVSASLVTTKMPYFGQLVSKKEFLTLNSTYRSIEIVSSVFFLIMSISFVFLYCILEMYNISYIDKFLPLGLICALLLMTFLRNLINCQACYIRSYKQEKHSVNAVITGLLVAIVLPLSGIFLSSDYFVISYVCVVVLFAYPHSLYIFLRFKKRYA
jgi:O-antigen/teichoic acid export membrane protein